MIGHVRKYKATRERIDRALGHVCGLTRTRPMKSKTFFYFHQRLVEAEGIKDPLLAVEWLSQDENGEFISSLAIPISPALPVAGHV